LVRKRRLTTGKVASSKYKSTRSTTLDAAAQDGKKGLKSPAWGKPRKNTRYAQVYVAGARKVSKDVARPRESRVPLRKSRNSRSLSDAEGRGPKLAIFWSMSIFASRLRF
ncbi:MAG: hypothetical protein QXT77_04130, partial [Candidatus Methanomethylicaceae archaeon]